MTDLSWLDAPPAAVETTHPFAAFPHSLKTWVDMGRAYPRAGVRRMLDGKWLLQVWYTSTLVRHDKDQLVFETREAAMLAGFWDVHACRSKRHPAGMLWLDRAVAEARQEVPA